MNKCKNCMFFEQQSWHIVIDPKGGLQSGGDCKMIARILSMDNNCVRFQDSLYVYEDFSCSVFKEKT